MFIIKSGKLEFRNSFLFCSLLEIFGTTFIMQACQFFMTYGFQTWSSIFRGEYKLHITDVLETIKYSAALVRKRNIPSDRRLSAKLVPTFVDRGCRVVSATDPTAVNLDYLKPETLFFHSSNSSVILTRLSGTRSRTTTQKIW
jgi:hypothetical protein